MRISHWLCPTQAGGPGSRLMLWLQGCTRGCPGCVAPELQPVDGGTFITAELLGEILAEAMLEAGVTGLTISGGEPLDQSGELVTLCGRLKPKDCLLYTGYSLEEAEAMPDFARLKPYLSVIVTDPYVEALNDGMALRGSSNQHVMVLKPEYLKAYSEYGKERRRMECVPGGDTIYFTGLPG